MLTGDRDVLIDEVILDSWGNGSRDIVQMLDVRRMGDKRSPEAWVSFVLNVAELEDVMD